MEVRVLGPLEVLLQGVALPLGGTKQRTVLALLAVSPNQTVATNALILGVYGDDAPPKATRTIHTYVSNLRHEVGDLIVRSGDGYRLVIDDDSRVDASEFEALYFRGSALIDDDPALAGSLLREALSLWRGHAFADVDAHAGLEAEITRLTELRVSALEARVQADLARGAHREIIGELEALSEQYPLRETLRAHHMLALYRAGRQAEALRAYRRTRSRLGEELGIEPAPQLQELEEMILTHDPKLDLTPTVTIERRALLTAELGDAWYSEPMRARDSALARRDDILSAHAAELGGMMFDVRGNAALAAFATVGDALQASRQLSRLKLQVAIDHGEVEVSNERITGPPVNRSLRLAAVANPGQIIISSDAHAALTASGEKGWSVISLGSHEVRGIGGSNQLFQLAGDGLETGFGPLRLDRLPQALPKDGGGGSLPGYELREEIGSSGGSIVYRAYQASVGRQVAIRVFDPGLVSDPRFIRRFESLAQTIAAVEHPHFVPMLDYWREPGRAVLIHRLINGETLRNQAGNEGLEADDVCVLAGKIGSALALSHEFGLVHGRVSAGNVLLDEDGNPYLADLGVSTIVGDLAAGTGRGELTPSIDVEDLRALVEEVVAPGELRSDRLYEASTIPEFLAGLRSVVSGVVSSAPRSPARNPYKGLASYGVGDAADFYGRSELIAELVDAVAGQSLTIVVGPSGIGKSSVVKAGVVPALRGGAVPGSEDWLVVDMYPGDRPFDHLETAMKRVALSSPEEHLEAMRDGAVGLSEAARGFLPEGTTLVLVIDQFEELFTHVTAGEERERFLALLANLAIDPEAPVKVVATMRADFFDRPLMYAEFGGSMSDAVVPVSAPSRQELAAIVECPAAAVGVSMEHVLVEELVEDAHDESGGLPLLQLALTELFDGRSSDRMTFEEYRSAGGLAATVGRRAEQVFRSLSEEDQGLARRIFLSLVSVDEDTSDTKRRVRTSELEYLGDLDAVERVLEAFGNARLLVFDRDPVTREPTAEVAHEALITRWDRLRGWIDEVRDDLLIRRRVEVATREWLESGYEPGFLFAGSRLERGEAWRDESGMRIGPDEARFLRESRDAVDLEQTRVARTRRRVLVGLSSALVVVMVLGVVAWNQRNVANRSTVEARVQELAAQAHLAIAEDPNLAINLALEAYDESQELRSETPGEVMAALQATVQSSRLAAILPDAGVSDESFHAASWSPDSSLVAVASSTDEDEVVVYTTDGFTETARFDAGGPVFQVAFAPDGRSIAVSYHQGETAQRLSAQAHIPTVARFEVGTWMKIDEFVGPCCAEWFEFSPDGRFLAAAGWWPEGLDFTDFTTVWNTTKPDQPLNLYEGAFFESWAPDSSSYVAVQTNPDRVHLVDVSEGERLGTIDMSSYASLPNINPATGELVVTLANQALTRILSASGELIDEYAGSAIIGARFSLDGRQLIRWGNRDDVLITTLETGDTLQLHGHGGGAKYATQSPDGRFLAVTTQSLETMIWDLTEQGPPGLGNVPVGRLVESAIPGGDGTTWHATRIMGEIARGYRLSLDGSFDDTSSGAFTFGYQLNPVLSPSGLVAGRGTDLGGRVENIETGEVLLDLPEDQCVYPIALDDAGELVFIGGGERCGFETAGGGVIDLASGQYLFEMTVLPVYAAFGHPGTVTEDLVIVNNDFTSIEVRQLPDGRILGSMPVDGFPFRPFISYDGRWATWGSQLGGAFLLDLEAMAAGAPMEEAIVLNPHVEAGPTHFTRAAGNYLAASYSRGVIRVWRIDSGELWFSLPESDHPGFTWLVFSHDGRYLFYADGGVLRRMPLDADELVSLARKRSQRDFSVEECERFLREEVDCAAYAY